MVNYVDSSEILYHPQEPTSAATSQSADENNQQIHPKQSQPADENNQQIR